MKHYPEAYMEYLVYFHSNRDYFECHEVLEEYWKEQPQDPFRQTWVSLIQLAVSLYHQRRHNVAGAVKMMEGAIARCDTQHLNELGVDGEQLRQQMVERLQQLHELQEGKADLVYSDMNFPFTDESLLHQCMKQSDARQWIWGSDSEIHDEQLIHKHTLRDRSEVIQERAEQLERKRSSSSP
ncbi:DUF309 domain-containing protein [Longirhabdus pacifica]|uniref:DUF309 domain-containing protein n=1 Tax=Longirhabdus pacifica TaxID=2305227 RepID=UPI0010093C1C|nr:DUF309 domain-containing protein [Longirhabdus pacifica]